LENQNVKMQKKQNNGTVAGYARSALDTIDVPCHWPSSINVANSAINASLSLRMTLEQQVRSYNASANSRFFESHEYVIPASWT
jgi:hypothetical protein